MCFAPQRRAIFRHLNFKKWSGPDIFCAFSLENVLLATAACNFSTSPELTCFVHFHLKMSFSPQRRAIFRHLNFKKWSEADVFCTFSLQNVLGATAACNFSTSQLPKVLRDRQFFNICTWKCASRPRATAACNFSTSQLQTAVRECSVLYIFTCKCASRHSGVQFFDGPELTCFVHFHLHSGEQFFDISTSKSGPKLTCFVHFHFKMCLAPQPRAIFQDLNFKKCSETVSFLTFVLGNVLLATAACNFSTSQLQTVVRECSGVQFFDISTSKSGPVLTCFGHFHLPQRRAIF